MSVIHRNGLQRRGRVAVAGADTPAPDTLLANAGPNATLDYGAATALAGSASGGTPTYTYLWTVVSKPIGGVVTFADATAANSNVTLEGPNGNFVLRLTITDSGVQTASDDVTLALDATIDEILGALYSLDWNASSLANGAVSSWASVGPNTSALVQATGSKQPVRSATSFEGGPGVTSDGGDVLLATLSPVIAAGTRAYFFLVYKPLSVAANAAALVVGTASESQVVEVYMGDGGGATRRWGFYRADSVGTHDMLTAPVKSENLGITARVISGGFTVGGVGAFSFDGGSRDTTATGVTTADITKVRLFAETDAPAIPATGIVPRLLVCPGVPDAAQIAAVDALVRVDHGVPDTLQSRTELFDPAELDATLDNIDTFATCDTDGRYVYYAPGGAHTFFLRHDSTKLFNDVTAWTKFDLTAVTGESGWDGLCFDGRYIYLAPRNHEVVRYDTQGSFTSAGSYAAFDMRGVTNSGTGRWYTSPFYDGTRYVYYPQLDFQTATGVRNVRFDTQASFTSASSYLASMATTTIDAGAIGFLNGTVDGDGKVYFNGHQNTHTMHSHMIRWDPNLGAFDNVAAWEHFNVASLDATLIGFSGMCCYGQYVYWNQGEANEGAADGYNFLRFDTAKDFDDVTAWSWKDLRDVSATATGFYGVFPTGEGHIVIANNERPETIVYDTTGLLSANGSYAWTDTRFYTSATNAQRVAGGCMLNGDIYLAPNGGSGVGARVYAMKIRAAA